jgi:hypothetical protein
MNSGNTPAKTLENYKSSLLFYQTALKNVEKAMNETGNKNSPVSLELLKTTEKIKIYIAHYQQSIANLEAYILKSECKSKNSCGLMGGKRRKTCRRSKYTRK